MAGTRRRKNVTPLAALVLTLLKRRSILLASIILLLVWLHYVNITLSECKSLWNWRLTEFDGSLPIHVHIVSAALVAILRPTNSRRTEVFRV